jgi:hypothetical protein
MGALLALLALVSFSTLASRVGGRLRDRPSIIVLPLVALGFTVAPRGLGYIDEETFRSLLPALDVGAAWLALLAGLGVPTSVRLRDVPRPLIGVLTIVGVAALTSVTVFSLPVALLVGATLAILSCFADDDTAPSVAVVLSELVATLGVLSALLLLSFLDDRASGSTSVAVLVGLGVSLAIAYLVGSRGAEPEAQIIALVALVLFGAGLARTTSMPTAPLAWIVGAIIGRAGFGISLLSHGLKDTSRPATLAVLLLSGAMIEPKLTSLLLGLALALILAAVRVLLLRRALLHTDVHSPGVSIAFAASVSAIVLDGQAFLTSVVVAVAGLEILSTLHTFLIRDKSASTSASTNSTTNATTNATANATDSPSEVAHG